MANIVQFSVDDTSPCIYYFPFGDTLATPNLSAGWNPYFVDSGFAAAQGNEGNGTSLHITSLDGATVSVSWRGTSIQLQGNATSATYSITLDGMPFEPVPEDLTQNVLATIHGLPNTEHTVFLTAQIPQVQDPPNSSMLVFDQAIIASTPPNGTTSPSTSDFYKLQFLNDSDVAFLGKWTFETHDNTSYHQSSSSGDRALARFRGTSVILKGTTSPQSGNYSVTLNNDTYIYSGRSSFLAYDTLLFYATGLDPNSTHTVLVENEGGGDLSLLMNGFGVYAAGLPNPIPSAPPTPTPTKGTSFPKGTIAAFILAGILAFFLLSGLLYVIFVYRPRKRKQVARRQQQIRRSKADEAGVILDIGRRVPSGDGGAVLDIGHPPWLPPRRESGKSGFTRWKREVEGAAGITDLGIDFRHSNDEKAHSRFYEGTLEAESEPLSTGSSIFPYATNRHGGSKASRKEGKNKGKGRRVSDRSWSPTYQVNLPFQRPSEEEVLPPSTLGSLSYMTAPAAHLVEVSSAYQVDNLAPPSYAASVSNRNSGSTQPSFPRSVNHSSSPSPPAIQTHRREGSSGQLLRYGEPNPGSPIDRDTSPESSSTPPIPVRHLSQSDRGSIRDHSIDEDPAVLSGAAVRQVLRSLSPRTSKARGSPRPPKRKPKQLVQRPIEMEERQTTTSQAKQPNVPEPEILHESRPIPSNIPRSSKSPGSEDDIVEVNDGVFLSVPETSPFKVTFDEAAWLSQRGPTSSNSGTQSRYESPPSSQGHRSSIRMSQAQQEFVQGTSRQPFRLTPASLQPLEQFSLQPVGGIRDSFIDFTHSSDVSMFSRSNNHSDSSRDGHRYSSPPQTRHGLPEEKSRWSSTNSAPVSTQEPPGNGNGNGSDPNDRSMSSEPQSLPSSTFPIPFQISVPSNTQFLDPSRSRVRISDNSLPSDQVHVHPQLENLESPTESIPVSVSDLNFRHSDTEEVPSQSQRGGPLSPFPPHPPLPGQDPSDPIMTPNLSSPNYIVQRVLGLHSPASTTTARPAYSHSGSTSAFYATPLASARFEPSSSDRNRTGSDASRTTNP